MKSSTESELIGADDGFPLILWCKYFIEEQGYTVEVNRLYQDNKSTMLLAKNGRSSSSKRTKHIKARYFFIKDRIADGDLDVMHCPTVKMWADVLNKPKQGKTFRVFRSHLMNCPEVYVINPGGDDDKENVIQGVKNANHPKIPGVLRTPLKATQSWGLKTRELQNNYVRFGNHTATTSRPGNANNKSHIHRRSVLGKIHSGSDPIAETRNRQKISYRQ